MIVLIFVLISVLFLAIYKVCEYSGFSKEDSIAIALLPPIAEILPPIKLGSFYGVNLYFSISGFFIPFLVSIKQIVSGSISIKKTILGTFILTLVSHLVSNPGAGGVGILYPQVPIIVAVICSLAIERKKPAVMAYVISTLGMFIGADLLNLSAIKSKYITIGGAGLMDAIYMTGLASLLITFCFHLMLKIIFDQKRKNSSG